MTDLHEPLEVREHIIKLNEQIIRAHKDGNDMLDRAMAEKRELTAEDYERWERVNADITRLERERDVYAKAEQRKREGEALRSESLSTFGETRLVKAELNEAELLRSFLKGQYSNTRDWEHNRPAFEIDIRSAAEERRLIRSGMDVAEARAIAWDTGSIASAVPVTTARSLYAYLEASIAMFRMPTTKFNTSTGEQMKFPRNAAHAIATQVSGQGTALAGTDPTFDSYVMDAYKYGELVKIANEAVTDPVFPVVEWVTRDVGRAIGRKVDADLVAGSGSGAPNGVMTAIVGAGTIASGGSLITPAYEKLIDLIYSVNDEYRAQGDAAWLVRDATAGQLRKLRDGAGGTVGAVLWQPSLTQGIQGGQPGLLLDYPVYTDPNVASLASNNKIIAFGSWGAYWIRQVGNPVLESDASRYFDTDELAIRGKWRVDGEVADLTALNVMKQSV